MLIVGRKYSLTEREIGEVAVARVTQRQAEKIVCFCCGRLILPLSRDSGFSAKWLPVAGVMDRLRRGAMIDGRSD